MIKKLYKILCMTAVLFALCQTLALAADKPINMMQARSSIAPDKVRIVLQFDNMPVYKTSSDTSGQNINIDFSGVNSSQVQNNINVDGDVVTSVKITNTQAGSRVSIALNQAVPYTVNVLQNPSRIFVDVQRYYERSEKNAIEDGLNYTEYSRRDESGVLKAYILDVDPLKYELIPVLGGGRTMGKNSVSAMARYYDAEAAVNASYFGGEKDVYGLTKIDGIIATTTYLPRTAFGTDANGKAIIDMVNYNGSIHTKYGDLPINGVNCERSADTIVAYNSFYGASTGTNEYGIEYVVQDDKIVKINTNNSPLKDGQTVISAHGTMQDALKGLKIGDSMVIKDGLGSVWDNALQIVGVGPQLVKNGQVDVTSDAEQIGPDVTGGRAPRTAAAIKTDGHVLLVVVDGRCAQSDGLTLNGMAEFLIKLGAVSAVNFDGGGSSEMVLKSEIMNTPSDGMERPVGVALAVVKKN